MMQEDEKRQKRNIFNPFNAQPEPPSLFEIEFEEDEKKNVTKTEGDDGTIVPSKKNNQQEEKIDEEEEKSEDNESEVDEYFDAPEDADEFFQMV